MYTATLNCGSVLSYEVRSFLPPKGESVPCRSHGFCVVVACGTSRAPGGRHLQGDRARPRQREELIEFLRSCPVTTIAVLRRQRFTLRLLAQAERDGVLVIDAVAGTVEVVEHALTPWPAGSPQPYDPSRRRPHSPSGTDLPLS